jgi:hypothetical protein
MSVNYSTERPKMNSARKGKVPGRTAEPGDRPVVLEPYAFSSLLRAAVEIHGRESLGFLIGHPDRQFIKGKMTECVSVNACCPVQSAFRGKTQVGFSNLAARHRVEQTVNAVGFEFSDQDISTNTSTGKLLLCVLAGVAEFERELIRGRTKAGLARAKAQGKRLGRPRKAVDMVRANELRAQGLGYRRIARELGVSHQTLFLRLKNEGWKARRNRPRFRLA